LDIGIANWSTNTNIARISRTANYKMSVENHRIFSKATATTGLCLIDVNKKDW